MKLVFTVEISESFGDDEERLNALDAIRDAFIAVARLPVHAVDTACVSTIEDAEGLDQILRES